MKQDKLSKAEKILVKGLIELYLESGYKLGEIKGSDLEVDLMRITGNCNGTHRDLVEEFIDKQVNIREFGSKCTNNKSYCEV